MTNTIKTWKERKGLLNSEPFRAFIGVEWEMQAEIDELRAALTEAISKDASLTNEGTKPQTDMPFVPLEKEDAEGLLQDVAAYIGVGGFNGATPKQLSERICVEFERLNNKAQTAQPVREPLQDSLAWELWLNSVDTANNTGRLVSYTYKEAIERAHNIRGEN